LLPKFKAIASCKKAKELFEREAGALYKLSSSGAEFFEAKLGAKSAACS